MPLRHLQGRARPLNRYKERALINVGPVRAVIVHHDPDVRTGLRLQLAQHGLTVAAETGEARGALGLVRRHHPALILLAAQLPETDSLHLAENIQRQVPQAVLVLIGRTPDAALLRRAMRAGAREYLVEPVDAGELAEVLERFQPLLAAASLAPERRSGSVIVVGSNKGGVGKTTISANLAVALRETSGRTVALVDLDVAFGDIATVLDLPTQRTIADLAAYGDRLDQEVIESVLTEHRAGVKVLPAPRPGQEGESVTGDLVSRVLGLLGEAYDYVVVDTGTDLNEAVLAALDVADLVLLVTALDLVSLKNIAQMLDLLQRLGYSMDHVRLVANRWNGKQSIPREQAEATLRVPITFLVPNDYGRVIDSINRGLPLVSTAPQAPITKSILEMSRKIAANGRP